MAILDAANNAEEKIERANDMAMIGANSLLFALEAEKKETLEAEAVVESENAHPVPSLLARAERYRHYNRMYGTEAAMVPEIQEELAKEGYKGYKSLQLIPYPRAQAGAATFVMGKDENGDLCMLLLRKKGEDNYRPPQGYFKPVPAALGIDEETKKKNFDTDLLANAKRELKAEVEIDVDQYKDVKVSLLGTYGHNENPDGNDMTTIAGAFLFDFTKHEQLPKLGKGYDEGDFDPELPFDSVIWVKVKDMIFKDDEIRFPQGHITTNKLKRGPKMMMDYDGTKKAIVQTLDNQLFAETGFTKKTLRAQFDRPENAKLKANNGTDILDYFKELTFLGHKAKNAIQCLFCDRFKGMHVGA
jgi:hypothetical protein